MSTLTASDLSSLQTVLKSLTKELKKFTLDKDTLQAHAKEFMKAETERETKL